MSVLATWVCLEWTEFKLCFEVMWPRMSLVDLWPLIPEYLDMYDLIFYNSEHLWSTSIQCTVEGKVIYLQQCPKMTPRWPLTYKLTWHSKWPPMPNKDRLFIPWEVFHIFRIFTQWNVQQSRNSRTWEVALLIASNNPVFNNEQKYDFILGVITQKQEGILTLCSIGKVRFEGPMPANPFLNIWGAQQGFVERRHTVTWMQCSIYDW